jgi:hypothetical protein
MLFLAPQFLWLLLALPIIVLLHFIRVRRQRLEVAALFLWRQAEQLSQRRRRFSPTWLLLLQLLAVSLTALALARPVLQLGGVPDRVLVIDASASMAAHDSDGVRLAKAVAAAEAQLRGAGRVAVVRAGLDATVTQALTDDHWAVRRALNELVVGDERADLRRGLELARALAPNGDLHLFTDHQPPTGIAVTWHPVGGDGLNLGISVFELRAQQAFVSVVSNHPRPQEVELEISRGDALIARTTLLVPSRGQANTSLPFDGAPGFYRASLRVPEWDALALDNVAYAGSRALRVTLVPPTPTLERAFTAIPGVALRQVPVVPLTAAAYDILAVVGPLTELPSGRALVVAPAAAEPRFERLVEWDRADLLLRFVDLTGVTIGLDPNLPPLPEGDWQVLARSETLKPVIVRLREPGRDIVALRFNPAQSDIVNRIAFPILIANIIDAFRGEERLPLGAPLPPQGVLLNGQPTPLTRAVLPGVYTVAGELFTTSLQNAEESRLPVAEAVPVATAPPVAQGERAWAGWLWLVLLALVLLVAEWLLWSRGGRAWASGT